eukprot:GHVU01017216.1.p2 GENE.GHVU01017216.1~~GHVU01017216.1.p2  ORF type:complete len:312 (+),score=50.54 GHVU01017216.1:1158-2093(+)
MRVYMYVWCLCTCVCHASVYAMLLMCIVSVGDLFVPVYRMFVGLPKVFQEDAAAAVGVSFKSEGRFVGVDGVTPVLGRKGAGRNEGQESVIEVGQLRSQGGQAPKWSPHRGPYAQEVVWSASILCRVAVNYLPATVPGNHPVELSMKVAKVAVHKRMDGYSWVRVQRHGLEVGQGSAFAGVPVAEDVLDEEVPESSQLTTADPSQMSVSQEYEGAAEVNVTAEGAGQDGAAERAAEGAAKGAAEDGAAEGAGEDGATDNGATEDGVGGDDLGLCIRTTRMKSGARDRSGAAILLPEGGDRKRLASNARKGV